jgi:hypothetical protein
MHQEKHPFPGRLTISPSEAATAALGWTPSTTRTKICRDEYPLPLIKIGGRKLVRVSDLIEFIESQPVINNANKRKPGRPTKKSKIEQVNKKDGAA